MPKADMNAFASLMSACLFFDFLPTHLAWSGETSVMFFACFEEAMFKMGTISKV